MHLIFAFFWLLVGVGILLWPNSPFVFNFAGVQFSGGWIAIIFALYNVARWWSIRSYRQARQAAAEAEAERERRHRDEARGEQPQQLDPNFNFTEPPTAPEGEQRPS
jgi:hypothetical protein